MFFFENGNFVLSTCVSDIGPGLSLDFVQSS